MINSYIRSTFSNLNLLRDFGAVLCETLLFDLFLHLFLYSSPVNSHCAVKRADLFTDFHAIDRHISMH